MLKVTNNVLVAADCRSPSLLVFLDLTAAFNTVDHVLHHLHVEVSLCNNFLYWLKAFISNRLEYVSPGLTYSSLLVSLKGQFLGSYYFSLYILPLGQVMSRHCISYHCYVDGNQLYIRSGSNTLTNLTAFTSTSKAAGAPSSPLSSLPSLTALTTCLEEIRTRMSQNISQLNCC